jgi:valyl-tRNA synthetase
MEPLAKPAIEVVRNGEIEFLPAHWKKTYFHWMENIRDWCISRQLWWGHRIPAWTCEACGHLHVAREAPDACEECDSTELKQDEDVLDTWFSSGLWPFSTLGWPEDTPELTKFYPTSVMETGFDIIFFWVARMIFLGLHFTGEVPFHTVFLHAMVRDKNGQKMSKTKGNVIDPLHMIEGLDPDDLDEQEREVSRMVIEEFPDGLDAQGADALRFTLAMYAAAGRDIKLDVQRVAGYKAFANKLWNAARFAFMNLEDYEPRPFDASKENLSPADRWILTRLRETASAVHEHLEGYKFSDAAHTLYDFVWHELCDWYLELSKPVLYGDEFDVEGDQEAAQSVLVHVLDQTLRLLHPFMPFITEEIWQKLPLADENADFLCLASWPNASTMEQFEGSEQIDTAIAVTTGIRRIRGESNVPPSREVPRVLVFTDDEGQQQALKDTESYILRLAKANELETGGTDTDRPEQVATTVEDGMEIVIPIAGLIDVEAERERIQNQLETAEEDIAHFEKKLSNPQFVENAPDHIVQKDRDKLAAAKEKKSTLLAGLERLE